MMNKLAARTGCLLFLLACSAHSEAPQVPTAPSPSDDATHSHATTTDADGSPRAAGDASADAAAQLAADFARMEEEADAEDARWTPELRANVESLTRIQYSSVAEAYAKLARSPHRAPGNAERDEFRRPAETLEFFGLKPTMTVLEYGPGGGWYTEFLAPMLAARGQLIVTSSDPDGPTTERATLYGQRLRRFLTRSPELYGKVAVVIVDRDEPRLKLDGVLDMALVIRGLHGWVNSNALQAWLSEVHRALKPGGVLGIVQHRADPAANPIQSSKQGYLPEPWVVEQVRAAGFELTDSSEMNANPKDTREHPAGVWTLPPTLRLGDTDQAKYRAIGESDRMTLRFAKTQ